MYRSAWPGLQGIRVRSTLPGLVASRLGLEIIFPGQGVHGGALQFVISNRFCSNTSNNNNEGKTLSLLSFFVLFAPFRSRFFYFPLNLSVRKGFRACLAREGLNSQAGVGLSAAFPRENTVLPPPTAYSTRFWSQISKQTAFEKFEN